MCTNLYSMFTKDNRGYYTTLLEPFKEMIEVEDIFVTQLRQNLGAYFEVSDSRSSADYYLIQKLEGSYRIFLISAGRVSNVMAYQRKLNRTREQIKQDNEDKLMQAVQLIVSTLWEINLS